MAALMTGLVGRLLVGAFVLASVAAGAHEPPEPPADETLCEVLYDGVWAGHPPRRVEMHLHEAARDAGVDVGPLRCILPPPARDVRVVEIRRRLSERLGALSLAEQRLRKAVHTALDHGYSRKQVEALLRWAVHTDGWGAVTSTLIEADGTVATHHFSPYINARDLDRIRKRMASRLTFGAGSVDPGMPDRGGSPWRF